MAGIEDITAKRIIPVLVLERASAATPLGDALVAGGIHVAEVTFRTDAAEGAIRQLAGRSDLLVGAGTVLDAAQVDAAVDAGAGFIVSPGLLPEVVHRAGERGVPVTPGAVTPSEIMVALSLGINVVKFFPAGTYGGASAIKALAAPFRQVRFIPTGGVSETNLSDYLSLPMVPAVGGSWMAPPELIAAEEFGQIVELSRAAVNAAHNCKPGVKE